MRYFVRVRDNPGAKNYQTPLSLHRFELQAKLLITEWWDKKAEKWVHDPDTIAFIGFGGSNDYEEITEMEAMTLIKQWRMKDDAERKKYKGKDDWEDRRREEIEEAHESQAHLQEGANTPVLMRTRGPMRRVMVEKGSEKSGYRGPDHKGLPGVWGGSRPRDASPEESETLAHLKPEQGQVVLSEVLKGQFPETARWDVVRNGIDLIDSIHTVDETLAELPIKESRSYRTGGGYWSWNKIAHKIMIVLNEKYQGPFGDPTLATLHEVAHWLDHMMLGKDGWWLTDMCSDSSLEYTLSRDSNFETYSEEEKREVDIIRRLAEAWRNSEHVKALNEYPSGKIWIDEAKTTYYQLTYKLRKNMLGFRELFARSYVQWAVGKSNDAALKDTFEYTRRRGDRKPSLWPHYFSDDDFEPISEIFDELFETRSVDRG